MSEVSPCMSRQDGAVAKITQQGCEARQPTLGGGHLLETQYTKYSILASAMVTADGLKLLIINTRSSYSIIAIGKDV